jgi:type I restriction enzyme S subunit
VRINEIEALGGGTTFKELSKTNLENFEIDLPPLPTQSAIARVLSSLDDKIELNSKINKELENLAKTIYDYWFVQNADKRWEKGKLSEIANITMGQSPAGSSYNEKGEGIIFYQGCTDFGSRFPAIRQYTTKPSRFAEVGDILLSVRAPVGTINFANKKCCIGRGLAALNSKIGSITHLYFILKDLEMVFKRRNTDGTTFGAITKDDLFSLSVTKPPKGILAQYEKIAKPIFEKQFKIAEESDSLAQLRDFLLPLLMNGQVKVKNVIIRKGG